MSIALMLSVMFGTLLIGVPIGAALSLGLFALLTLSPVTNMTFVAQSMYSGLASYAMLCVPFFMVAGSIMEGGGLSKRIVDFANSIVGNITGGLGIVTILSCMFFGAVSGSAAATCAAIGVIMIPEMVRHGYDKYYATGLVAVSGTLGVLIPPSYPLVLYGVTNNVSIGDLFIGGIGPGLFTGGLMILFNYYMSKKHKYGGAGTKLSIRRVGKTLWDAKLALMMPLIILGGIYAGIFTATESAVIACVYGVIVGLFFYKELTLNSIWKIFKENTVMVGGMMLVFAPAAALGSIFAFLKIPAAINSFFLSISTNPYIVLTMIVFVLFVAGMFVQTSPIIVILSPMLLGVAKSIGISPLHFGMIITMTLCTAFITPPVAINLFVASGITGLSMTKIFTSGRAIVIALITSVFIIAFVPGITTFLVNLL